MKFLSWHLPPPEKSDPRKLDGLLAVFLYGVVFYFTLKSELSDLGDVIRMVIALSAMLLTLTAAMSENDKIIFVVNIFLALFFYSLFVVTFAVKYFGFGDWYISDFFGVSLKDVIMTGLLGVFFYGIALRVSIDLYDLKN